MKCIFCGNPDTKVTDSRVSDDGLNIRRRRLCPVCGKKVTTIETIAMTPVMVIKRNGERQQFEAAKLQGGVLKACEKRPIPVDKINDVIANVTQKVYNSQSGEVSSKEIGEWVMDELKNVDQVAYVRFASVHREFKDIATFLSEIEKLMKKDKKDIK